jgi:hypothetical protein
MLLKTFTGETPAPPRGFARNGEGSGAMDRISEEKTAKTVERSQ